MNYNILFLDSAHPCLQQLLEEAGYKCEFDYTSTLVKLAETIHLYDGLVIRSRFKLDSTILDKALKLKFIARVGAGMENIDVAYAESKGIKCLHAPEGNRDAVGEHAMGMLLSLFNNLCRADKEVREGKWIREGNRGIELKGKTVGLIGYGNMGSAFAERLTGFGVNTLAYDKYKKNYSDRFATEATLERLFEETDVLSLHVPLTDETLFMVDDSFINQFKKNIFIINTARGKVIKTEDLVKNLKTKKVLGACLDVLEYEDVSFEKLKSELNDSSNYLINSDRVILSPHIAGWTVESNEKLARVLAGKIKTVLGK